MIKKLHIHFLVIALLLTIASPSLATNRERITMDFEDSHIYSRFNDPTPVFLKKELRKRFPGVDLSHLDLRKAIVVAKSRRGHGTVKLKVGKNISSKAQIGGSPQAFHSTAKHTFDRLKIDSPSYSSNGPWQLLFNGNIVLRKIVLIVDNNGSSPKREHNNYYGWSPDYNSDDRQIDSGFYSERIIEKLHRNDSPLPMVLPAKTWGTSIEGEKRCGQKSNNSRDGWDYPNTICDSTSKATYHRGYQPTQLYIQPDARVIDQFSKTTTIRSLDITVSASPGNRRKSHGPVSATFGITINGQTYSKAIYLDPLKAKHRKTLNTTLKLSGNWSKKDIHNSKVWILPNWESGDFTVTKIQSLVTSAR